MEHVGENGKCSLQLYDGQRLLSPFAVKRPVGKYKEKREMEALVQPVAATRDLKYYWTFYGRTSTKELLRSRVDAPLNVSNLPLTLVGSK